jgi:hypothetical protein
MIVYDEGTETVDGINDGRFQMLADGVLTCSKAVWKASTVLGGLGAFTVGGAQIKVEAWLAGMIAHELGIATDGDQNVGTGGADETGVHVGVAIEGAAQLAWLIDTIAKFDGKVTPDGKTLEAVIYPGKVIAVAGIIIVP